MLCIAIPCLTNAIHVQTCKALIELRSVLEFELETISFDSLIPRARDYLVHRFLKNKKYDKILFLDSDIVFSPHDVLALYSQTEKDIVCAGYPKKRIDPSLVRKRVLENPVNENDILTRVSKLAVNIDLESKFSFESNYIKLKDAPTGFLMINRNVFETIIEKKGVNCYHSDILSYSSQDPIANFFTIEIENGRLLSEDYSFSRLCQKHGFTIFMNMKIYLKHIGTYVYT